MKAILLVVAFSFASTLAFAEVDLGLHTAYLKSSNSKCRQMSYQIGVSKKKKRPYVEVASLCESGLTFYDKVYLEGLKLVNNDRLEFNGVNCGSITTDAYVIRRRDANRATPRAIKKSDSMVIARENETPYCWWSLADENKKTTYFNSYQYLGKGEPFFETGNGEKVWDVIFSFEIDENSVPTLIITKIYSGTVERFRTPNLTAVNGEIFYKDQSCGTLNEKGKLVKKFTDQLNNCKYYFDVNNEDKTIQRMYLLNAPFPGDEL